LELLQSILQLTNSAILIKRFTFILLLFFVGSEIQAQNLISQNLQRFDNRKIHFGFSLGLNSGGFALQRKPNLSANDSLGSLNVINQGGFSLGIVSDYHIHPFFNVRFLPTLVFGQRNMEYKFINSRGPSTSKIVTVESTYLDFPILFKYRSMRLNNFAAYFIGGVKYSVDLASNEDVLNESINESIIKLKQNTTSAEVGVGTDFFLPYFKFAIELKMSYGLQNVMIRDNTELSNPVEQIVPKMFFITFLFEG
tara:strand:+ start:15861 stop:16619 length:759 start_codon:yes stop_codon:yes gene_type:complete